MGRKIDKLYEVNITMTVNVEDAITGAWHQVVMTTMRHKGGVTTRVFNIDGTDHNEWCALAPSDDSGQRAHFVKALHDLFDAWPHGDVDGP